jgi:hypothetical protein
MTQLPDQSQSLRLCDRGLRRRELVQDASHGDDVCAWVMRAGLTDAHAAQSVETKVGTRARDAVAQVKLARLR